LKLGGQELQVSPPVQEPDAPKVLAEVGVVMALLRQEEARDA